MPVPPCGRTNVAAEYQKEAVLAVKFLTEDWITAVQEAMNSDADFAQAISEVDLSMQFKVTDAPDGASPDYSIAFAGGNATVALGELEGADVSITNDYETAVGISKGDLNTQTAFMTGKLKVAGNMGKLMMNQGPLNKIGSILADLDIEY